MGCSLYFMDGKKEIRRLKAPLCGIYVNKKKAGLFILLFPNELISVDLPCLAAHLQASSMDLEPWVRKATH